MLAYDNKYNNLFEAIAAVESNHNDAAVGDGGKSIGRYQIQYNYWKDATEFDKSIGGVYEDVKNPVYAQRIMTAYWNRYARTAYKNKDFETLARIHNGGPQGHRKQSTVEYWNKVQNKLNLEN